MKLFGKANIATVRKAVRTRHQAGFFAAGIARDLGLTLEEVRELLRREGVSRNSSRMSWKDRAGR